MAKRILIATGGTGGHIYPAVALAQQFACEQKDSKILFVGGGLAENRYFEKTLYDFRTIACSTFKNKSPACLLQACWQIAKGIRQSCAIIREFKPDVAVGFGSYYSFPPLVGAKLRSIPIILHEANSIPGKVNRLLAPFASATGVHFPETINLIKGAKFRVGMPLRKGFQKGRVASSTARKYFGLKEKELTLLVFGGSQGSFVINTKVQDALALLKNGFSFQVIHIAGGADQAQQLDKKYQALGVSACVKAFEDHMELAWQAADFVICRAGASSVAEQLEFEVPGILIPFSRAADDHQNSNADFLVRTVQGAFKIQEKELIPLKLADLILDILGKRGDLLEKMKLAMLGYKAKEKIGDLYSLVNQIVAASSRSGPIEQ